MDCSRWRAIWGEPKDACYIRRDGDVRHLFLIGARMLHVHPHHHPHTPS